ncbi:rhodanese-like domain-containing protein [Pseudorhodoferax sp. Leaf274]|uniref:rhodanese-like domain-containing protein n=1 Tax=Pseudorhodoferax sp. Leaf274 TaxID=1736318 RepID=UPI000702CD1F|nr:rhodanese-like domain-containing protein [Pseudorhodoferax sp. Leaf274]KQP37337.1 sulfurtransferase [Pseudorhodoferax sp. Leaf274]
MPLPELTPADVRRALRAREEIALLDLREEDPFAQSHPLWAANLPLSRIELEAWRRIPRRDTLLVLYGTHDGEDLVPRGAAVLAALGYTRVAALAGGLQGWTAAGGEVFRDVNVPSKAFGELVEHERHTPSLAAEEVQALIASGADAVVVDARRFDEYQTMSIPGATSVPGAELVLRARELAPDPATRIVVNCAGRTRSIIGTQSLVNAGVPNPVAALRNGTIGWLLAGQQLDHGAARRAPQAVAPERLAEARRAAAALARRAGARTVGPAALAQLRAEPGRTLYAFDVRTPEEYAAGHLPGFASAPGGQLVQETDHSVPVRGARIVLADDDGVRASMTASWLAQMGWEVYVLEAAGGFVERGAATPALPPSPAIDGIAPAQLADALATSVVIDLGPGQAFVRAHIPGAWFAIRAQLRQALDHVPAAAQYVLASADGAQASYAAPELRALLDARGQQAARVRVLAGGTAAWAAAGLPTQAGETRLATPRTDRYRRPYEGTDAPRAAMQAYLDWEFGLVAQLGRDGTHLFQVV